MNVTPGSWDAYRNEASRYGLTELAVADGIWDHHSELFMRIRYIHEVVPNATLSFTDDGPRLTDPVDETLYQTWKPAPLVAR